MDLSASLFLSGNLSQSGSSQGNIISEFEKIFSRPKQIKASIPSSLNSNPLEEVKITPEGVIVCQYQNNGTQIFFPWEESLHSTFENKSKILAWASNGARIITFHHDNTLQIGNTRYLTHQRRNLDVIFISTQQFV